jgi:hypothetical protein
MHTCSIVFLNYFLRSFFCVGGGEEGERGEEEDEVEEGGQAQIEGRLGSSRHDDLLQSQCREGEEDKEKERKVSIVVWGDD